MEQQKKRLIIYKNNEFVTDYTSIINILNKHNCTYTRNSNGLFINLITISDDVIDELYPFFINNTLDKYKNEREFLIQETEINEKEINQTTKQSSTKKEQINYQIPLEDFSMDEKKIIKYSNNYIL